MTPASSWLVALLAAVLLPSTIGCVVGADVAQSGSFTRTLRVSGPVDLGVRTGSGTIRIQTGADDTVLIVGHIQAYGRMWSDIGAAEQVKRLKDEPPIDQRGNVIRVGDINDPDLHGVSISFELTVPAQTRIRSVSGSGSQSIGAVRGPVDATTGSGRLYIDQVGDHVRAFTGSGGIDARGAAAGLDAQAGSGSVRAEGIAGTVRVRTGSGRVDLEQVASGPIDISTGSGAVTLHVAEQAAYDLDARTGSGSIETRRPVEFLGASSRHRLHGRVGGGGPHVSISTGSGSIYID